MNRSKLWLPIQLLGVAAGLAILTGSIAAQTTTQSTVPSTQAEKRAAAQQAAQAKRAAAQQAAQERQAAAQEAAQEKKAQRTAAATGTATTGTAATTAGSAYGTNAANAVNAARNQTTPGTTTTNSALAGSTTATRNGQTGATTGSTVDGGTLSWATRVYTSSGCTHNGNRAVCTFTFVNQGNEANLVAGGGGELSGIQLVDDAHVPHRGDGAYFLDKYGSQQPRLIVQPGDTGTYVVTFPNVNPQVASAEFHLRQEVIGGIKVGSASATTAATTTATTPGTKTAK